MVTDIMKIIDSLNNNIEGINNSLKTILDKDGGVVIHDTYANVSTWVDLGTTLVATIVGAVIAGFITLHLFKKQERMRLKEDFRLNFYKDYEVGYQKLLNVFNDCYKEVTRLNNLFTFDEKGNVINFIDGITTFSEMEENYDYTMKKSRQVFKALQEELEDLEIFMESKKTITGYESYKFKEIKKYAKGINQKLSHLGARKQGIITDSVLSKCKERYKLKDGQKPTPEQISSVLVDKYRGVLVKIIAEVDKIQQKLSEMQDINSKIEKEFIGTYFE